MSTTPPAPLVITYVVNRYPAPTFDIVGMSTSNGLELTVGFF